jgi:hypothetical protein
MNIELTGPRLTQLVGQFVSDVLIEERLRRYPEIGAHFSGHLAESRARSSCCHQMAWRLGTWRSESIFGRLEEMLRQAKTMPGWEGEQGMLANSQYSSFWSLVWQLQVAEWLAGLGFSPKWNNPGPDLLIEVDGHQVWLECYSTVGFCEPVEFLGEILPRIHPELKVDYSPSDRSASPDVPDGAFLETCVVTVESKLPAALEDRRTGTWPILLYKSPDGAISVRLYGGDIARYAPSLDRPCTVDFEGHFRRALLQAFKRKIGKNGLASNRPNVVMTNLVVNELFQVAVDPVRHLSEDLSALIPSSVVTGSRDLDAVIWTITGVDEKLTTRTSQCVWKLPDHPLRTIVERASAA